MMTLLERLEEIARKHCFVPQLTPRNSDRLDFHDVGCVSLADALAAAYRMGRVDEKAGVK
jgi:hypothetical protein